MCIKSPPSPMIDSEASLTGSNQCLYTHTKRRRRKGKSFKAHPLYLPGMPIVCVCLLSNHLSHAGFFFFAQYCKQKPGCHHQGRPSRISLLYNVTCSHSSLAVEREKQKPEEWSNSALQGLWVPLTASPAGLLHLGPPPSRDTHRV